MQILELVLLVLIIIILIGQRFIKARGPKSSRRMVLDSCALIDGRIIELSKSGFVPDALIVPEFVLAELQLLADGSDSHKRERARFGLDVVKELQSSRFSTLTISKAYLKDHMPTDDKLVALAQDINAALYTTDYNLNKVADIKGVQVLNVNELAQQLRPAILPGERIKVKIVQRGTNQHQGVGYLDDGTMVVVDHAAHSIGKVIDVEIIRNLQTVAGKMLFAQSINQARRPEPAPQLGRAKSR